MLILTTTYLIASLYLPPFAPAPVSLFPPFALPPHFALPSAALLGPFATPLPSLPPFAPPIAQLQMFFGVFL
jgi:hypothetical protein